MEEVSTEIEKIRSVVGRYFSIYDTRVGPQMVSFYCHIDRFTLDQRFDDLRKTLIGMGYIPLVAMEDGHYLIHVQRKPSRKPRSPRVNSLLLGVTLVTTIFAGMTQWSGYARVPLFSWETFYLGAAFFAIPLLLILGVHEMGHYLMAKRHKVEASLPFFIPSIPPLGTFGAVISMREPIPDRKALLDIGIAGPLCGLAIAIPVALAGLYLTGLGESLPPREVGEGTLIIYFPMLYEILTYFLPIPSGVPLHPMAFAGWVGFFVTALNLIPAGQLDGGHIARALLGKKAHYLSYAAVLSLFLFGFLYVGWIIVAILIILIGARHPPPLNDLTPLSAKRKIVGAFAGVILITCFVLVPIAEIPAEYSFRLESPVSPGLPLEFINISTDSENCSAVAGGTNCSFQFVVNNTGNVDLNLSLGVEKGWILLGVWFSIPGNASIASGEEISLVISQKSTIVVEVTFFVPSYGTGGWTSTVVATVQEGRAKGQSQEFLVNINAIP